MGAHDVMRTFVVLNKGTDDCSPLLLRMRNSTAAGVAGGSRNVRNPR